jgi:hypothetical protein
VLRSHLRPQVGCRARSCVWTTAALQGNELEFHGDEGVLQRCHLPQQARRSGPGHCSQAH